MDTEIEPLVLDSDIAAERPLLAMDVYDLLMDSDVRLRVKAGHKQGTWRVTFDGVHHQCVRTLTSEEWADGSKLLELIQRCAA